MHLSQLKTPRQWSSAIGMQEVHFKELVKWFKAGYQAIYGLELNQVCKNLNKPFIFDTYEDLLFFVLVKIKSAATNDMISLMFNITASTAQYNYSKGVAILEKALQLAGKLPARKFQDTAEFLDYVRGHDCLLIDVTEIQVERPQDKQEQEQVYSGKKNTTPTRL